MKTGKETQNFLFEHGGIYGLLHTRCGKSRL